MSINKIIALTDERYLETPWNGLVQYGQQQSYDSGLPTKNNQGQSNISCLKNITLTLILSLLLLWSCVVIIVALSYTLFIAH
jgi:hypothetical protein